MTSKLKWWGYRHTNGSLHTKRYFDHRDLEEPRQSPFVAEIHGPFEAENANAAREVVRQKLGTWSESGGTP